jgi:hypothetical protein
MEASEGLLTRHVEGLAAFGSCLTAAASMTVDGGGELRSILEAVSNVNVTTSSHRSFMEEYMADVSSVNSAVRSRVHEP